MKYLSMGRNRSYVYYHELTQEERALFKHSVTHLKLSVQYHEGGINYFSGATNARGYRLSNTPVERNGSGMESMILLGGNRESGYYVMLEVVKRFSMTRLTIHAERLDAKMPEIARAIIQDKTAEVRSMLCLEPQAVGV